MKASEVKGLLRRIDSAIRRQKIRESEASHSYDLIVGKLIESIVEILKSEKIAKSEDLPDFTKRIKPALKIDIWKAIEGAIDKHLQALHYVALGEAAGKDAVAAIEEMCLKTKVQRGGIIESYLDATDTSREYWSNIFKVKAPDVNEKWRKDTLSFIKERAGISIDKSILEMKTKILSALENHYSEHYADQLSEARASAIESVKGQIKTIEDKRRLTREAIKMAAERKVSVVQARQLLKDVTADYSTNWDRIVRTEYGMASSVGAVQSIQETAGRFEADPAIAIIDKQDDRESDFCTEHSHNKDGSWRYWRLSSLKPPGYNIGKKKRDWLPSLPLRHISCRCFPVYVPPGFGVDNNGSLRKLKEGETINAE